MPQRRERLIREHGLPPYDAEVLTQSPAIARYYDATAHALAGSPTSAQHKTVSNWVMSVVMGTLSGDDEQAIATTVPPARLAGLLRLVEDGTISGKIAKDVFERMLRTGEDAATIVAREGLTQVADAGALEALVTQALAQNPRIVLDYKSGKTQAAKALVGAVMKASGGRANPTLVTRIVEEKLSKT